MPVAMKVNKNTRKGNIVANMIRLMIQLAFKDRICYLKENTEDWQVLLNMYPALH